MGRTKAAVSVTPAQDYLLYFHFPIVVVRSGHSWMAWGGATKVIVWHRNIDCIYLIMMNKSCLSYIIFTFLLNISIAVLALILASGGYGVDLLLSEASIDFIDSIVFAGFRLELIGVLVILFVAAFNCFLIQMSGAYHRQAISFAYASTFLLGMLFGYYYYVYVAYALYGG